MYFGSQYYRYPFPNQSDWERDIKRMNELGFNVIKLWAVWNTIEKTKGVYEFAELDELVQLAKQYGLKVIINIIPEGAPYWTEKENSQCLYKKANGETLNYSGPANIPTAGWPGLCLDNKDAQDLVSAFLYETAKHFADNDSVISFDVWNEPHLEPMFDYSGELLCYCDGSIKRFREWLKEKYLTLDKLNKTWFRCYTDWEQVMPPTRFGTYTDMIDWRRFWVYNLADWLKLRVNAVKRGAPNKLTQTHVPFSGYMGNGSKGGLGNFLGDEFLLSKEVDVFGLTSFPLWLMGEKHFYRHLINVEIVAEASGTKPFYQVELQGGAGKAGLLGGYVPTAEDIRIWNWNVIAGGGKGVLYWQYSPEPAGIEAPGFGLIDSVGGDTPRLLSASECAKQFNKDYLTNSSHIPAVNGIYLSRTSDLLTYAAKEEDKYAASFDGIYKMLYDAGIPARFVHNDTLEKAIDEGLKVLYLPMTFVITQKEQDALVSFVKNGGRLILEAFSGMYYENGEMDMQSQFLNNLLGLEHVSIDALKPGKVKCKLNDGNEFSCHLYRQLFSKYSTDAQVLATFDDGNIAALKKNIGKGEVLYLAGCVGSMYTQYQDNNTLKFITSYFDKNGFNEVEQLETEGLVVRLLKSGDSYIIISINHSDGEKTLKIKLKNSDEYISRVKAKDGNIIRTI